MKPRLRPSKITITKPEEKKKPISSARVTLPNKTKRDRSISDSQASPISCPFFSARKPLDIIDDSKKINLVMPPRESIVDEVNRALRQQYIENGWPLLFCKPAPIQKNIVDVVNEDIKKSFSNSKK